MKKVNQHILLFFVIVMILFTAGWQFIQSDFFVSILSKRLNTYLENEYQTTLQFKKITYSMYPPGIGLNQVTIQSRHLPDPIQLDQLAVSIRSTSLLSSQIKFDSITAKGGAFYLQEKQLKDLVKVDSTKEDTISIVILNQNLLRSVILKEIDLYNEHSKLHISSAELIQQKNSYHLKTNSYFTSTQYQKLPDHIFFDGTIHEKEIRIQTYRVLKDSNMLWGRGTVDLEKKVLQLEGQGKGMLSTVFQLANLPEAPDGFYQGSYSIQFPWKNSPEVTFKLTGSSIKNDFVDFDSLAIEGSYKNQLLTLQKVKAKKYRGTGILNDPISIPIKGFVAIEPHFTLKDYPLESILHFAKDLRVLTGEATGHISLSITQDDLLVTISEKSTLRNFRFIDETHASILQNPLVDINRSTFHYSYASGDVTMDLPVSFRGSSLHAKGIFQNKSFHVKVQSPFMDLYEFGPIFTTQLKGEGPMSFEAGADYDAPWLKFKIQAQNASIDAVQIGNIQTTILHDLTSQQLTFTGLKGHYQNNQYHGEGSVDFLSSQIAINVNIEKGQSDDLPYFLSFLFPEKTITQVTNHLKSEFQGNFTLQGDLTDPNSLTLHSSFSSQKTDILNEYFDQLNFKLSLIQSKLFINELLLKKKLSSVTGQFSFDTIDQSYEFDFTLLRLRLSEFLFHHLSSMGLDGELEGEIYGNVSEKNTFAKCFLHLRKSTINQEAIQDSQLVAHLKNKLLMIKGHFQGEMLTLDSGIHLEPTKASYINLSALIPNLKTFSSIFARHNGENSRFKGRLDLEMKSQFHLNQIDKLSLQFKLNDFYLNRNGFLIKNIPSKTEIDITQGKVTKWDLLLKHGKHYLQSQAEGDLKKGIKASLSGNLSSNLLEVPFSFVKKMQGNVSLNATTKFSTSFFDYFLNLSASELESHIEGIPDRITNLGLSMILSNNLFSVQKFNGRYGNGDFTGHGTVLLRYPFPEFDLKFQSDSTFLSLFNKDGIVIDSDLQLIGKKPPYILEGSLNIQRGQFLSELNRLLSHFKPSTAQNPYLPQEHAKKGSSLIQTSLSIKTLTPILIKNSLTDLKLESNLRIRGSLGLPRIDGLVNILPHTSKIVFRGSEFIIKQGTATFSSKDDWNNPDIFVRGTSKIKDYTITFDLFGKSNNLDYQTHSEPVLSQDDIFSLLAFGVTYQDSLNMTESERQSLTSIGIGSILLERFQLDKDLKQSLGMSLVVTPEYDNTKSSAFSRGGSSLSQSKTATKIKLKKKLSSKADLSFSSAVGNPSNQYQQMNLDYNVNSNITLQGIYERKDGNYSKKQSTESLGADIRFRKTFK